VSSLSDAGVSAYTGYAGCGGTHAAIRSYWGSIMQSRSGLPRAAPRKVETIMFSEAMHVVDGSCDWCGIQLGNRTFHFEAKRYCCRACLDAGVASEISRPLFETKPFPPELRRLRAHIPFY